MKKWEPFDPKKKGPFPSELWYPDTTQTKMATLLGVCDDTHIKMKRPKKGTSVMAEDDTSFATNKIGGTPVKKIFKK